MPIKHRTVSRLFVLVAFWLGPIASAAAMDHVTLRRDGKEIRLAGRLLVKGQDGGLLLLARDGALWVVRPDEQVEHTRDDAAFKPLSHPELSKQVLGELPQGFDVYKTTHYLIFYDTSRAYAQWCGALFERLYMAFRNYWKRKGIELTEPEFPLTAVIFADKNAYQKFSQPELGEAVGAIIGYFSLQSNRMTMYDLTGIEAPGRAVNTRSTFAQINRILAQPEATRQVSTIVHEATHQIAFNCGMHQRFSDCPLWLTEGIAMFFETPDLRSARGWRSVGAVNRARLTQFRRYLRNRPADSLETLIRDNIRFRDPEQALDAYAEAWALTYYLINHNAKQYLEYLKMLTEKKPLRQDGPAARLEEFRQAFGDPKQVDAALLRYMSRDR